MTDLGVTDLGVADLEVADLVKKIDFMEHEANHIIPSCCQSYTVV